MVKRREQNTFKFQGFAERISNIKLDVSHRVEKRTELPEETETFCNEALNKWRELNCTLHFQELNREIHPLVQTLAQLVHHERQVVELLKKHLLVLDSLALEPTLDLVVQIARDLQCDFYPYFKDFFAILVSLLSRNSQDSELLEQVFSTLGYLFKFLWRYLVKDIGDVFRLYSPLLSQQQKPYIQQFAAESFAFLTRKVKDQGSLMDMLFCFLKTNEDLCQGVGCLCFEMIKGVRRQFHSHVERLLPEMLARLGPVEGGGGDMAQQPWNLIFVALSHTFQLMAKYTTKEHSQVVEKSLTGEIQRLSKKLDSLVQNTGVQETAWEIHAEQLSYVLKLTDVWVVWNDGNLVSDATVIYNAVVSLLKLSALPDQAVPSLFSLTSSLLLGNFPELARDRHLRELIKSTFSSHFPLTKVFIFAKTLLRWSSFTQKILPPVLDLCQDRLLKGVSNDVREEIVFLLTEVVLIDVVSEDGCSLDVMSKKGLLFLPKCGTNSGNKILDVFLSAMEVKNNTCLALAWGVLVCVQCIRPLDVVKCGTRVLEFLQDCVALLQTNEDVDNEGRWLHITAQAIRCCLLISTNSQSIRDNLGMEFILGLLSKFSGNVHILHACSAILSHARTQGITDLLTADHLQQLYPLLKLNLSSSAHLVRLMTLKIMVAFDQLELISSEENPSPGHCSLFQVCLDAECTPPTFQHYRNKLVLLRKLFFSPSYHRSLPEFYHDVTIRYLLGQLYINFSPTWEPLIEIIKSHTLGDNVKRFWEVFSEHLGMAADNAAKYLDGVCNTSEDTSHASPPYGAGIAMNLHQLFTSVFSIAVGPREDNRTDHVNFRYLLWKAMASFPGVVEIRSRDLVPLFLRFVSTEYAFSDDNTAPSQDIRKKDSTDTVNTSSLKDPVEDQNEQTTNQDHKKRRKAATKSLCIHLNLFGLFHNPKALSKEPQVRKIYMAMLAHRDSEVQKLAVKCLLAYKFPYTEPYKEHFDKLLEDESFRDELARFTVDEGNAVVDPVHREGLMPIVIRILYGKMQRWTGAGTSGKSGIGARRSVILRFLGSCPHDEVTVFMDLILAPFNHLCTDPDVIPKLHNLSTVVPLKKQQGFLNMMGEIFNKLGMAMSPFIPTFLQICLSLLYTCVDALQQRDEVHPPHVSQLKVIRQLAITRLTNFFELIPSYDYTSVSEAVYEAAVWPQVESLGQESIQSPTPLLKLLHSWSKNPRFHPLLSKKPINNPDLSIMSHVYSCLKATNVNQSVVTMAMEMTENLLTLDDYEPEEGVVDLCGLGSELSTFAFSESATPPSYGTRLVLPHTSALLEHLSITVKALSKSAKKRGLKKSKSSLPKLELSILSKISSFIEDPENSASLIKLLVPFLYMRQREETENNTLRTIQNLLSNVRAPSTFSKPLGRLFSQLNARSSRQCLCEVFGELAMLDTSFATVAQIVTQMNAWDRKRVEEPNYAERVAGFSSASHIVLKDVGVDSVEDSPSKIVDSPPIPRIVPVEHILPLLHNCLFFVHRTDDLAIRDSAVSCLNSILQRVVTRKDDKEFEAVIMNCVLPSCKLALKSKSESSRHEFLGVLSSMVRQFDHACFSDMRTLIDTDPEADFFENMKHIQLHRRIRALRRLETNCHSTTLNQSTLVDYMLPLATSYLLNYSGAKDHNLVTQAIATVGAISGCLPWSKYSHLLRQYLKLLQREKEKRKIVVRVIVAILNAFHFDLSKLPVDITSDKSARESNETETKKPEENKCEEKDEDSKEKKVARKEENMVDENDDEDEEEDDEDDKERRHDGITDIQLARRIYDTIATKILPQLHKSLTKKVQSFHRLSHSKQDDDDNALRVPIALAMVKLLQALPQHTLHLHLPGLLVKVCLTLQSRARDVRDAARDTLCQIALSLGTKYFAFVLKEMRSSLTRGYQLHVLGFTLHSLLDTMTSVLSPGDLDHCLPEITEVLVEDLFGEVATEREVDKITNKLPEAKSSKSQDSFEILAKFVGPSSIMLLVAPLKQVLDSNQNHKTSRRVEETLRRIGLGLQANTSIATQTLMIFIHGLTSDKLPLLATQKTTEKKGHSSVPDSRLRPQDTYAILPEPTRGGKTPELSNKTNAHVVVEFGLQLLHTALKRGKVSSTDLTHLQMLDPFVSVMVDCLQAKHTKVLTLCLRCLCWIIKLPLPSLDKSVPIMAKLLFKLLKKYAIAGAKVGDNFEMVLSGFKAMTVIIRDFKKYTIAEKHLQVLLGFVEEDVHDYSRQGTAFPLLKAILGRKLMVSEIHDVMKKVAQLSITGGSPGVQQQCRQCMLQFMLDYPLGKKLQRNLEFFVSQLGYEHEAGRESALEMMASIFSCFPESILFEYAAFFFVPLTTRLVNDDSANCRKLTALTIKSLLEKLDIERRDTLFSMMMQWFSSDKVVLRRLAAQVCGLFVEVEGKAFDRRLPTVLPLMANVIEPDLYEVEKPEEGESSGPTGQHKTMDHLLFNTLTTLAKVLKELKVIRAGRRKEDLANIWASVEVHLLHPHSWVRLVSSRLFGLLFAAWTPEELEEASRNNSPEYLADNMKEKVTKLCEDSCAQLESPFLQQELGDQVVKNLVFLAKVLHYHDSRDHETGSEFTLLTLLNKMERLATREASQTPKKTEKRSCVLRWLAAVTVVLGKDDITPYLKHIVQPIHRELEIPTTYKDPNLQNLAQEVLELIKGLVGREAFSQVYATLQHNVTETREKRKRQRALEAVADPSQSARRKMKRNLAKKETRKRKIDAFKPERKLKRTRPTEQIDSVEF